MFQVPDQATAQPAARDSRSGAAQPPRSALAGARGKSAAAAAALPPLPPLRLEKVASSGKGSQLRFAAAAALSEEGEGLTLAGECLDEGSAPEPAQGIHRTESSQASKEKDKEQDTPVQGSILA
jgi:hypothetical protein